jgi:hypothetical protein
MFNRKATMCKAVTLYMHAFCYREKPVQVCLRPTADPRDKYASDAWERLRQTLQTVPAQGRLEL